MQPTFAFLYTYYPEFLDDLYTEHPAWVGLDFEEQRRRLLGTGFGVGDAYSHGMRSLGCHALDVIVNADHLQAQWAAEHGLRPSGSIHDVRRQIVAAQIAHIRPDVLYVFEWCPLGDAFLADVKASVRLLVGQIASPLPVSRNFSGYDLMISSWPPLVDYFRTQGTPAELINLAFDERVLDRLERQAATCDISFVGGFAPSHRHRVKWLERLLEEVDIDVFGYGSDKLPVGSAIDKHHRGPAWGMKMYEALQRSRLTLNCHAHIDVRGDVSTRFANNMRLFEATGVGSCLITESRDNLADILEPGREVVTYRDEQECIERIRYYLANDQERESLALAGQRRTLREHTYAKRTGELLRAIRKHLS